MAEFLAGDDQVGGIRAEPAAVRGHHERRDARVGERLPDLQARLRGPRPPTTWPPPGRRRPRAVRAGWRRTAAARRGQGRGLIAAAPVLARRSASAGSRWCPRRSARPARTGSRPARLNPSVPFSSAAGPSRSSAVSWMDRSSSDQKTLPRLDSRAAAAPPVGQPAVRRLAGELIAVELVGPGGDPRVGDPARDAPSSGRPARCHSRASRAAAAVNRPGLRSGSPRSWPAELIAIRQPSPGSPITSLSGTKTSSRKISAKPGSPSSCAIGRDRDAVGPQVEHEVGQAAVPLCVRIGAEQAERRGRRTPPRELQVFWPDSSQPPSVRPARGPDARPDRCRRPARTTPGPRPRRRAAIGGRIRSCCSSVPCANSVGREHEQAVLADPHRPARAVVLLLEHQPLRAASASRPPYSAGQDTAASRGVGQLPSHSRCAREPLGACPPTAAGWRAGSPRATRATSARNACIRRGRSPGFTPAAFFIDRASMPGQRVGADLGVVRVRDVVQPEHRVHAGAHAHLVLALVHRALGQRQPEVRHPGDPVGQLERGVRQLGPRHHAADHAQFVRPRRAEPVAGEQHLLGEPRSQHPRMREVLDARDAHPHHRVGEERVVGGDDQVADPGQHQPAGDARALHHRDRRLGQSPASAGTCPGRPPSPWRTGCRRPACRCGPTRSRPCARRHVRRRGPACRCRARR